MENWLIADEDILLKVIISLLAIFCIIIVITRIAGLRTFAKMSSFDFAATIAIGSILASVIMNNGQSITKGAIALIGIVFFQFIFSFCVRKSKLLKSWFTNSPLLLMKDGEIIEENLKKANLDISDVHAKLREANVFKYEQVSAVILESTGDISVLHSKEECKIEDRILKEVIK